MPAMPVLQMRPGRCQKTPLMLVGSFRKFMETLNPQPPRIRSTPKPPFQVTNERVGDNDFVFIKGCKASKVRLREQR